MRISAASRYVRGPRPPCRRPSRPAARIVSGQRPIIEFYHLHFFDANRPHHHPNDSWWPPGEHASFLRGVPAQIMAMKCCSSLVQPSGPEGSLIKHTGQGKGCPLGNRP